jgi:uncharacterized ferredoxin-like protein
VRAAAEQLMNAAMTAPKACAVNNLVIAFAPREDAVKIGEKMIEMHKSGKYEAWVGRDGRDVKISEGVLLIGTKYGVLGVSPCGSCGFENCAKKAKQPGHPCMFNGIDLGIALGSVVSRAADMRLDNRMMFSIGLAAREMGLFPKEVKMIVGIPLDVKNKSHFYDRTESMMSHVFQYPKDE